MYITLWKRNGNVIFPEYFINGKSQVAFDIFNLKRFICPEKQLKIK
jgi:hypothetical protein